MGRGATKIATALVVGSLAATGPGAARGPDGAAERAAGSSTQADDGGPAETFYETATVMARSTADATASVAVIDEEALTSLAAVDVAEALGVVAGVSLVTPSRGSGGAAQVRGGEPNFTLVLLDGVPLNEATDSRGGGFDLSSFSTLGLAAVELVRGPVSSFYGSTGLGGVVNLRTRVDDGGPALAVVLGAGSDDWIRGGLTAAGGEQGEGGGGLWGSLAAQHEREEGAVALDPARPDRFEQTALMGSGSWQPVADRRLDMRLRAVDDAVDDWPEGSGGPDAGTGELRRTRRDEWVVTLAGELVGTRVRHRGSLSRLVYDAEIASPAIPPQVPPGLAATRFERSRLFYTAAGGGGGAAWAAGAELGRERGRNDSVLLLPPGLGGAIPGDYDLERDAAALLLGGNFATRPGDDSLTLDLGLRLDAPEGHGEEWSPRLGIGWRPGDGPWRLRASAGRAFKLPSFFALGSPPALGGNPELSPETSTAIDVGTLVEAADGRVRAGLTLFRSDYDDLIDFDFASFRLVNRSRVRAEGVEIELAAALAAAPSGAWTLRAQATWQSVEDRDTGGELLRRPDRLAAAVVTWRPAWGGDDPLRLTLDLRYRGRMLDEQVPTGRRAVGGHTLVALAAEWRLHTRLAVVGRLENVFDEAYETQTGYPGPGRTGRLELRIPLLRPRR